MLYMLLVKASTHSEQGILPSAALRDSMDRYLDELDAAGVKVMAKGLAPTDEAIRIAFLKEESEPVVIQGPFVPAEDIVAGFFLLEVGSKEEAVRWALKAPDPQGLGEGRLELRRVL
jgi:hypothetical protein